MSYLDGAGGRRFPTTPFAPAQRSEASSSTAGVSGERTPTEVATHAQPEVRETAPIPSAPKFLTAAIGYRFYVHSGIEIEQEPYRPGRPPRRLPTQATAQEVEKRLEDLGYEVEPTPAPGQPGIAAGAVRMDRNSHSPSFTLCQRVYRDAYELASAASLDLGERTKSADQFDALPFTNVNDLVTKASYTHSDMLRERNAGVSDFGSPAKYLVLGPVVQNWEKACSVASTIRTALADPGVYERMSPESAHALKAAALRIDIAHKFSIGVCDPHGLLPPNGEFEQIIRKHGMPAALRIAYHHRATQESPLWRHFLPDTGELPEEYASAFQAYDASSRECGYNNGGPRNPFHRPTENDILSCPMKTTEDKIRQDRRLCDQLQELTRCEIDVVKSQLADLRSASLSPKELGRLNELTERQDELNAELTSLARFDELLQGAAVSEEAKSLLDRFGYTRSLNILARYPDLLAGAENMAVASTPGSDATRIKFFDTILKTSDQISITQRKFDALQKRLSSEADVPERNRIFVQIAAVSDDLLLQNENLEALRLAKNSPQFADLLLARGPDEAVALARTASLVARQASFAETDSPAHEVFDALLACLRADAEDAFGAIPSAPNAAPADAAYNWMDAGLAKADLALRALNAYDGMLSQQIADPHRSAEEVAVLTDKRDDLQGLMHKIQTAIGVR